MISKLTKLLSVISVMAVPGLITACAGMESRYAKNLPATPGTNIQLHISADIPLHLARVYSQKGQLIKKSDIDKYETYCSVLMNKVQESGQPQLRVLPGRFQVTRVKLSNDYNYQPRIFASLSGWKYDPPSNVIYQTELRLKSPDQPLVRSLICARRVDAYGNYYPQKSDFKSALGELVQLQ